MGNVAKKQEELQRNIDSFVQSQVQETPNVMIKQSKSGNVDIVKLNMQIVETNLIYDSVDKLQIEITISSHVNCQIMAYYFVSETKNVKGSKYEKCMQQSITKHFKLPATINYQIPAEHIEFMIIDLLKFQKLKTNPEVIYHTLILELKALNQKGCQIIYFYKIECNETNYHCELYQTKQLLIYRNRIYEMNELFGIKNTPFNPQWNPNTVEDKDCIICFSNLINTVLLPCKHMCTCSNCTEHIINNPKINHCPLCRIDLDNYLILEVKNKQRKDEQSKLFLSEQQKFQDSIKEKKKEQELRQSQIMEQLQFKAKETQEKEKLRQQALRNRQFFENVDDFNLHKGEDSQDEQEINQQEIDAESNQEDNSIQDFQFFQKQQVISDEDNKESIEASNQKQSYHQVKQTQSLSLQKRQYSQKKETDQLSSQNLRSFFDYMDYDEDDHYQHNSVGHIVIQNKQNEQKLNSQHQLNNNNLINKDENNLNLFNYQIQQQQQQQNLIQQSDNLLDQQQIEILNNSHDQQIKQILKTENIIFEQYNINKDTKSEPLIDFDLMSKKQQNHQVDQIDQNQQQLLKNNQFDIQQIQLFKEQNNEFNKQNYNQDSNIIIQQQNQDLQFNNNQNISHQLENNNYEEEKQLEKNNLQQGNQMIQSIQQINQIPLEEQKEQLQNEIQNDQWPQLSQHDQVSLISFD